MTDKEAKAKLRKEKKRMAYEANKERNMLAALELEAKRELLAISVDSKAVKVPAKFKIHKSNLDAYEDMLMQRKIDEAIND